MADQTLEKRSDGLAVEHQETLTSDSVGKTTIDVPVGIYADDISYGYSGIRGIIKSPYIFGAALLASMGGFSYGYDQGVISLILVMPQFQSQYPETNHNAHGYGFHTGFMTGMLVLGGFIGCLLYPKMADMISRKWALTVAVIFFDVGAVIQTASKDYATLVVGRAIGGVGVGTLAMGAPLYISEISPPEIRGSLLVLEELSIVIGAIISYWVTYGTRELSSDAAFRLPFGLQMITATALGIGIHFYPYSPRWLAMVHRDDDALDALVKLRRLPPDDFRVQSEWKSILTEVTFQEKSNEREHPGARGFMLEAQNWLDLFRKKTVKRTIVACGVCFFTQFSGINAFVYYAPTLFTTLGQGYEQSLILAGMINIGQLVGVTPTLLFMDKFGRRPLAIWGAIGMGIPHAIMAGLIGKYGSSWPEHQGLGWFCVALVYCYVIIFGLTYGPLIWTMPAEVFPNARRAKGVGLAVAVSWLANFIIGVAVPPMLVSIGYGTFIFFAAWCFIAAVWAFLFVPEMSGKTLEQMDQVFGDNTMAHRSVAY